MNARRAAAVVAFLSAGATPLAAQLPRTLAVGGGLALAFAQERDYESSIPAVEFVAFSRGFGDQHIATEVLVTQDVHVRPSGECDVVRPCPQFYGLAGGAILFGLEGWNADGTPSRVTLSGGLGVYSVRAPVVGSHAAIGVQGDLDMAVVRSGRTDVLLAVKGIVLPKIRQDFLVALPVTIAVRWRMR